MKRKWILVAAMALAVVMLVSFSLIGCKTTTTTTAAAETTVAAETTAGAETTAAAGAETTAAAKKDYTIAVVPKDSTNPWFVHMENGVKKFAKDTGLNVFQKGPAQFDAVLQVQVIEDLIAQGVDAICVVPIDPAAVEVVLKKALDKGIVVITHEASNQVNTMFDIEAFDNAAYGAFIMDNLAAAMGEEGKYTTMVGTLTSKSHNEWADGGVARQKEKYPNMTLLTADPRVESHDSADGAYQVAKELFKKYPDLKGIMGTSSYDAPGVAKAIGELGLRGKAFTAGTGMPQDNAQILKDGYVTSLTLWDSAEAAYAMLTLAVKILNGEEIKDGVDLGVKGYNAMKLNGKVLIGNAYIVITKDNVDSFDF